MVRLNQRYSWKPPAGKQALAIARRNPRLYLDRDHFWLGERAGMLGDDRRPRAILVVLVRESNDQLRDAGPYVGESERRPIPAFPGAAGSAIVPFWVWGSKSST